MRTFSIEIKINGADFVDRQELREALGRVLSGSTAKEAIELGLFSRFGDEAPDIEIISMQVK